MVSEPLTAMSPCPTRVPGLFRVLDDLEQTSRSQNDVLALTAVKESKAGLEKLVTKMDSLEPGFDRIAERSCEFVVFRWPSRSFLTCPSISVLSSSRMAQSRRRCESTCFPGIP